MYLTLLKVIIKMSQIELVTENLNELQKIIDDALKEVCYNFAAEMEFYAKENRKWNDDTEDARKGLVGEVDFEEGKYSAMICQNMFGVTGKEYGYYLETAEKFHGKYAILKETHNHFYSEFFEEVSNAINDAITEAKLEG